MKDEEEIETRETRRGTRRRYPRANRGLGGGVFSEWLGDRANVGARQRGPAVAEEVEWPTEDFMRTPDGLRENPKPVGQTGISMVEPPAQPLGAATFDQLRGWNPSTAFGKGAKAHQFKELKKQYPGYEGEDWEGLIQYMQEQDPGVFGRGQARKDSFQAPGNYGKKTWGEKGNDLRFREAHAGQDPADRDQSTDYLRSLSAEGTG